MDVAADTTLPHEVMSGNSMNMFGNEKEMTVDIGK
jgi:hypothetical protein